jgi:hypothetical protein
VAASITQEKFAPKERANFDIEDLDLEVNGDLSIIYLEELLLNLTRSSNYSVEN